MAGGICSKQPSSCGTIYMPIMPRLSKRDEGGLESEHPAGGFPEGERGSGQKRQGQGGDEKDIYAWR